MCILPFHHVNVASPNPIFRDRSILTAGLMTSILESLQDPGHRGEDLSSLGRCLGLCLKYGYFIVHSAGLQVLVQCNLTRSTLPKLEAAYLQRRDGLGASMHTNIDDLPTLPKGILPLRRNRSIGQRHPNLLPLPLQLPLLLQPQPRRLFLQYNRYACLMSAYPSIILNRTALTH